MPFAAADRPVPGVLYREDDAAQWQQLLDRQAAARDYLGVIGPN